MKKAIGFLFCTAFYGIFFYWVKMNYGDEIEISLKMIFSDEIDTITKCVLFLVPWVFMAIFFIYHFSHAFSHAFGLIEFMATIIAIMVVLCFASLAVLIVLEAVFSSNYYIYLFVLWILTLVCLFSDKHNGSGGSYKSEWEKEQDWLRDNIQ